MPQINNGELSTHEKKLSGYVSGTFTDAQTRYTAHEKELLAVLEGISRWDIYPKHLLLSQILLYVMNFKDLNLSKNRGRPQRWQSKLGEFNYEVVHIKGKENIAPDIMRLFI